MKSLATTVAITALVTNLCNISVFAQGTYWKLLGNNLTNPSTHYVGTSDNTDLVFRTNAIERMRILNNGNLGVGTSTPSYKLDVSGTGRFASALSLTGGVTGSSPAKQLSLGSYYNSSTTPSVSHIDIYGGVTGLGYRFGKLDIILDQSIRFYRNDIGAGTITPIVIMKTSPPRGLRWHRHREPYSCTPRFW